MRDVMIRHFIPGLLFAFLFSSCSAQEKEIPDKEAQIKGALHAAPENKRDSVAILGYNKDGKVVELRSGSNEFICLADDPDKKGFNAACYHKSLEPFMAFGRELRAKGRSHGEIRKIRSEAIENEELEMPDKATLHVLTGKRYSVEQDKVIDGYLRYVVYIPFATPESTGLPTQPSSPGGPWIMDPGTHRAHIMINPPKK